MMKLKVLERENVMKYVKRISLAKLHVLMAAKNADPFSGLQDQGVSLHKTEVCNALKTG